jgi:hypothetical protein
MTDRRQEERRTPFADGGRRVWDRPGPDRRSWNISDRRTQDDSRWLLFNADRRNGGGIDAEAKYATFTETFGGTFDGGVLRYHPDLGVWRNHSLTCSDENCRGDSAAGLISPS